MAIWIRTVDPRWFDFVSSRPNLAEINLWTPAGRRVLDGAGTGDLVPFRVRGRLGLAGYGLFFNAAIYFAADAWQLFGPGNGAPTSAAFRAEVVSRHTAKGRTFYPLGCHDIVEPVYFTDRNGRLPEEAIRRLSGGPIDEDSPDGRLLLTFLEQATSPVRPAAEGIASSPLNRSKRRQVSAGRAGFQIALHDAYGRTCAITGVTVLPALEAVHFVADQFGGPMDVRNGILLRRDFHPLLEQGYMTVSTDYTVLFSKWLPRAYPQCETYLRFNRKPLRLPESRDLWPALDVLEQHRTRTFFKGGALERRTLHLRASHDIRQTGDDRRCPSSEAPGGHVAQVRNDPVDRVRHPLGCVRVGRAMKRMMSKKSSRALFDRTTARFNLSCGSPRSQRVRALPFPVRTGEGGPATRGRMRGTTSLRVPSSATAAPLHLLPLVREKGCASSITPPA